MKMVIESDHFSLPSKENLFYFQLPQFTNRKNPKKRKVLRLALEIMRTKIQFPINQDLLLHVIKFPKYKLLSIFA